MAVDMYLHPAVDIYLQWWRLIYICIQQLIYIRILQLIYICSKGGDIYLHPEVDLQWWRLIYIFASSSWYIFVVMVVDIICIQQLICLCSDGGWYIFAASSSWCKCHLGQKWISTRICKDIITLCCAFWPYSKKLPEKIDSKLTLPSLVSACTHEQKYSTMRFWHL